MLVTGVGRKAAERRANLGLEEVAMRAIKYWFWGLAVSWAATASVMSQDKPSTQSPALTISRQHLADYNSELRLPNGRVDTDAMVKRLKELEVNTYYHYKQLLVDGNVVWEGDVAGGSNDWHKVTVDVAKYVQGKTSVTLAFRLLDKKGVSNFGVRWRVDQLRGKNLQLAADVRQSQKWQVSRQGAFETGFGSLAKVGQRRFHIPFISMTAGNESDYRVRHGEPATPERVAGLLRISLQAWRDGKCDGVVTYCLDKRPRSTAFPPVRKVFHEFGGHKP
jgi:hypothetical protein